MFRPLDVATSLATSVARFGAGLSVGALGKRPKQRLELYEFEACPYCRKVREALSTLDLEAMVYPCPKSGPHYRKQVVARGGKAQFPYLIDPNTRRELYESDDIVTYLFAEYGDGSGAAAAPPRAADRSLLVRRQRHAAGLRRPLRRRAAAEEAARAVELRGLAVLPHRARAALRAGAPVPPAQRRQGQPEPRRVREALRAR